jgi:hypothetical protein
MTDNGYIGLVLLEFLFQSLNQLVGINSVRLGTGVAVMGIISHPIFIHIH